MTQLEIMTITGITGMLTGFSGAYPEELRNKCGQLNIDSNELYSIVTNPLYMQNGILTQAGEDRVRNFAGELKETIDSRRNALEADKEKHRLELSMLDHASFVLENLIAGHHMSQHGCRGIFRPAAAGSCQQFGTAEIQYVPAVDMVLLFQKADNFFKFSSVHIRSFRMPTHDSHQEDRAVLSCR